MKNLSELLAACGGERHPQSEQASLPETFQPIDIVLTVVPVGIDINHRFVTFDVLLDSRLESPQKGMLRETEFDAEISLPIECIHLAQ